MGTDIRQANGFEFTAIKHLDECQRAVPSVLYIMSIRSWNIADITSLVVERPCIARGSEDGDSSLTLEEETPFVLGRVPLYVVEHQSGLVQDEKKSEVLT